MTDDASVGTRLVAALGGRNRVAQRGRPVRFLHASQLERAHLQVPVASLEGRASGNRMAACGPRGRTEQSSLILIAPAEGTIRVSGLFAAVVRSEAADQPLDVVRYR